MSDVQKILIVDDREENLFALEKTLGETGATLIKSKSGNEALAATLEHDFALAVLDVQMPGMDGYELAELLRGDPKTRHLPIIFVTAELAEDAAIFKGYEAGAVDYLVKPYNQTVLRAKVSVFLQLDHQRQELQRQKALLQATNEELEAFAYSVSHDLRAPLRGIDGFSQALIEDYGDRLDETGKDYLERMSAAARRMGRLIDDILSLSRLNRSEMRCETVDLSAMAEKLAGELRQGEPQRQVELVIASGLLAHGDAALLEAAMTNLLGNAWKFTAGVEQAKIEVGIEETEDGEAYFVRDNGAGFDMAYADKLFGAFQRLHDATEFTGTGIGLAIVQRVVRRHGGRVWGAGEVGKGATLRFTLPIARKEKRK